MESYWTDPLTLATKALTDKGTWWSWPRATMGERAGPAAVWRHQRARNAPWVLTVGASSTMGTLTRNDDEMASYSSSGPTAVDFDAKPDLVAPGTGTISLAVPGSTVLCDQSALLLDWQAVSSAPMVVRRPLMLQANPNLTPTWSQALLQYTRRTVSASYSVLPRRRGS